MSARFAVAPNGHVDDQVLTDLLADMSGLDPAPAPAPGSLASPQYLADPHGLYARARRPDFGRWLAHAARARGCTRPVRLAGEVVTVDPATGAVLDRFSTDDVPDRVLYKPCGTRRVSVCPSCAETYRWDTYQLIAAGLRGGKGVPDSIVRHPAVFSTFTAPSFGPVHTRIVTPSGTVRPCRPRRDRPVCQHGRPASCPHIHHEDDPRLGTPFCLDCYDHAYHVVWNHFSPKLWDRTMTRLRRLVAARVGRAVARRIRLRFAKVAEYQRRGVVHLHAVIRLDGYDPDQPTAILPPPAYTTPTGDVVPVLDAVALAELVTQAVRESGLQTPYHPDRPEGWPIVWGEQTYTRVINHGTPAHQPVTEDDVTDQLHVCKVAAGYLAKYATKSTEPAGVVYPRITPHNVATYADPSTHQGRLIDACWHLGRPLPDGDNETRPYRGLRRWAHTLGFGGHFSTKSRAYSTTLGRLRAARRPGNHPTAISPATADVHDLADQANQAATVVIAAWAYVGSGWLTTGDAALAARAADAARARQPATIPTQ